MTSIFSEHRLALSKLIAVVSSSCLLATTASLAEDPAGQQRPVSSDTSVRGPSPPTTVHHSAVAVDDFLALLSGTRSEALRALARIEQQWHPGNRAMLLEVLRLMRNPELMREIVGLLERQSGEKLGRNLGAWYRVIWNQPYQPHPQYAQFKAKLYQRIDPRFRSYFVTDGPATIRLDEIRWGGVLRDGIPPLKNPQTLTPAEATYLADTDIVFGVKVNGEARAYPKRILAWHEMVKDIVGGQSINGVYCTLCGSMIVYQPTAADGTHHELGTSGFLYRSNKLMYDAATESLWSTIKGEPVVGTLVGQGIQLEPLSVVTTTWGQWRADHPTTRVLSLNTGHVRDYGEGVAYRNYFATDRLMFGVPRVDTRLKNKDEVFIVRRESGADPPLAISSHFLRENRMHHASQDGIDFVIVTDATGAHRAYATDKRQFRRMNASGNVVDATGQEWKVTEEALVYEDQTIRLPRLPAHRAFWFGWHAAHPNTLLAQ